MENLAQLITAVNPDGGTSISMVGDTYRILISSEQTGGAYSVLDMLVPSNGGPGPHAHKDYHEAFYIIEGELEVKTESITYIAKKGAFINIPLGGLVHQFKNKTPNLTHMLCILTPGGMEKMFEEIGTPIEAGEFMPPPEMTPELMKKFEAIAGKYGQKLYPPDYLK